MNFLSVVTTNTTANAPHIAIVLAVLVGIALIAMIIFGVKKKVNPEAEGEGIVDDDEAIEEEIEGEIINNDSDEIDLYEEESEDEPPFFEDADGILDGSDFSSSDEDDELMFTESKEVSVKKSGKLSIPAGAVIKFKNGTIKRFFGEDSRIEVGCFIASESSKTDSDSIESLSIERFNTINSAELTNKFKLFAVSGGNYIELLSDRASAKVSLYDSTMTKIASATGKSNSSLSFTVPKGTEIREGDKLIGVFFSMDESSIVIKDSNAGGYRSISFADINQLKIGSALLERVGEKDILYFLQEGNRLSVYNNSAKLIAG